MVSKVRETFFLKKKCFNLIDGCACLVFLAFTAAAVLVSLNRFWQYEVFYYDFGIFDQAIWRVSRFQAPIIEHFAVGGKIIFADHFNPSIFLLSPFYWLTDKREMILIIQAVSVGLSGLVLYRIGTGLLKRKLLSLSVLVAYYSFIGLQNAVITDFHPVTLMTLPLSLCFWSIVKEKKKWFFLFLFVTLGFKESTFLLGTGMGLLIIFIKKNWKKEGIITVMASLAWGWLSIKVLIPHFAGGGYQYAPAFLLKSWQSLFFLIDHPLKRETLFYSLLSFGFLPLMHWPSWPLILQDLTARFIPEGWPNRWGLTLHYSAPTAVIFAFAALMGLVRLEKIKTLARYLPFAGVLLMINALFLHQVVLHGPLGLAYNQTFFAHTRNFSFLNRLVARVPEGASVMTQNNLAPRFTHQPVWLLRGNYQDYLPDYIVIDVREGQNLNNFFGLERPDKLVEELRKDNRYLIEYQTNQQFIFKKLTN